MTSRIETILGFHGTRSFGTPGNLIAKSKEATQAYRDLSDGELAELIQLALAGDDDIQQILGCLACLHPGSLKRFQREFIERQIFLPGLIYHDADEGCAHEAADLIPSSSTLGQNHLLLCMAWAGNAAVQKLFAEWRDSPPSWVVDLHVPPHAYANEAGWELLPNGERHDLFFKTCLPLVKSSDSSGLFNGATVGTSTNQSCPWCGKQLVALLDLDPTNESVSFLPLTGTRLRVTKCHVCSCYGIVEADQVTKVALANYVVNSDPESVDNQLKQRPLMAFALCYVAAHLALDLVNEEEAEAVLNHCEEHLEEQWPAMKSTWQANQIRPPS